MASERELRATTSGASAPLARTTLQMPLLQPGDSDVLVGTRDVPRPRRTRRSRQPALARPAFHIFPAGAGVHQLYISSIHATGVKESNRRIHRETRPAYCPRSSNFCSLMGSLIPAQGELITLTSTATTHASSDQWMQRSFDMDRALSPPSGTFCRSYRVLEH